MSNEVIAIDIEEFSSVIQNMKNASESINSSSSGVDAVTYESIGSALGSYHSLIKSLSDMINHYHLLLNMDITTLEKCGKSAAELDKQLSSR